MNNDGTMPAALEIRVHGIGDHDAWSALGSAPLADVPGGPKADVTCPPILPKHRLWLINWSRRSRRAAGLLWYVALPFSLVNVAGYMEPHRGEPRRSKLHLGAVIEVPRLS